MPSAQKTSSVYIYEEARAYCGCYDGFVNRVSVIRAGNLNPFRYPSLNLRCRSVVLILGLHREVAVLQGHLIPIG